MVRHPLHAVSRNLSHVLLLSHDTLTHSQSIEAYVSNEVSETVLAHLDRAIEDYSAAFVLLTDNWSAAT